MRLEATARRPVPTYRTYHLSTDLLLHQGLIGTKSAVASTVPWCSSRIHNFILGHLNGEWRVSVRGVGRLAFPRVERARESSAGTVEQSGQLEQVTGPGAETGVETQKQEQRAARLSRAGDDRAGSTGSSQAAGKSRYWGRVGCLGGRALGATGATGSLAG